MKREISYNFVGAFSARLTLLPINTDTTNHIGIIQTKSEASSSLAHYKVALSLTVCERERDRRSTECARAEESGRSAEGERVRGNR